jgi:hypothetical protein
MDEENMSKRRNAFEPPEGQQVVSIVEFKGAIVVACTHSIWLMGEDYVLKKIKLEMENTDEQT